MRTPTSPATDGRIARRDREGGFTLIELVLALAILSLLAALALPSVRPGGGALAMRIKATEIAALLKADRNAAMTSGRTVVTQIDLGERRVAAGASDSAVALPAQMPLRVAPAGLDGFRFSRDGRSSGGRIELGARSGGVTVSVNPLTAAVAVEVY